MDVSLNECEGEFGPRTSSPDRGNGCMTLCFSGGYKWTMQCLRVELKQRITLFQYHIQFPLFQPLLSAHILRIIATHVD